MSDVVRSEPTHDVLWATGEGNTHGRAQITVFKAAAYTTLFVDAYLALVCVATEMMPRAFHHYLPPFGAAAVAAIPKLLILAVVAWTALLAAGCLTAPKRGVQGLEAYVLLLTLCIILSVGVGVALVAF
jgi:hypothetical protein